MKKLSVGIIALLVLFWSDSAPALLINRGGGLIYDTVLNVTWLQDANFAKTSGFDDDGLMSWYKAHVWAGGLEYYDAVRDKTWTGWRLSSCLAFLIQVGWIWEPDKGWPWPDIIDIRNVNGSINYGYNISAPGSVYEGTTGHELAYMYYNNLQNLAPVSVDGKHNAIYGLMNTGPFINVKPYVYWLEGEYDDSNAPVFYMYLGLQNDLGYSGNPNSYNDEGGYFAWAVRDGDVGAPPGAPTPLPGTFILFGSGLLGLGIIRKKMVKKGMGHRNKP